MFELKNYTFLGDFSILNYKDLSSFHFFIKKGGLIPKVYIGKKGVVITKNEANYTKIIGYKIKFFSVSKSVIILNPKRLICKNYSAIDLNFKNALGNKDKNISIKKVELSYVRSNFKKIHFKLNSKIKHTLLLNFTNKLIRYKLKFKTIKIES